MKKVIVVLLCMAMAVALLACAGGGGSTDPTKPEDQIVGKWDDATNEAVTLDFKADGTVDVAMSGEVVETMTYKIVGDQITFYSGDEDAGTMTIDGNELKESDGTVAARKQ